MPSSPTRIARQLGLNTIAPIPFCLHRDGIDDLRDGNRSFPKSWPEIPCELIVRYLDSHGGKQHKEYCHCRCMIRGETLLIPKPANAQRAEQTLL